MRLLTAFLILCLSSCGYTVQRSEKSHLLAMGLTTIYVEPLKNQTHQASAETLVYNSLVKSLAAQGVRLTKNKKYAQAILSGTITKAQYDVASTSTSSSLLPTGQGRSDVLVANSYGAQLSCFFQLNRIKTKKNQPKRVWQSEFSRSRSFSSGTQLGVLGTTSSLINHSEFEKALAIMAESMAKDVHQSLTSLF